jgi:PhnB protein
MKLSPHITLHFNGQCEAAFKFYEQCFGGKIQFTLTWGSSPMAEQAPRGWSEKLLHARIAIGDAELIGGDVLPEHYQPPKGFSILLSLDEPERAGRIFSMLAENGTGRCRCKRLFGPSAMEWSRIRSEFLGKSTARKPVSKLPV